MASLPKIALVAWEHQRRCLQDFLKGCQGSLTSFPISLLHSVQMHLQLLQ